MRKYLVLLFVILLALPMNAWALGITTHGAPKPVSGESGATWITNFNAAQDTFDAAIWADIVLAKNIRPVATATGVDTITATYSPAITLTSGTKVVLYAAGANTGAATFQPNSLTVKAIKKSVSTALVAGDIPAAGYPCELVYDGTNWILINPAQIDATTKAAASGVASLDGSSKVVQNPANATATPTAGKIPIADGSGKLDGWVTGGGGSGDVTGGSTSAAGELAGYTSTTGKAITRTYLKFAGLASTIRTMTVPDADFKVLTAIGSSTSAHLVSWSGTGGDTLADSGVSITDINNLAAAYTALTAVSAYPTTGNYVPFSPVESVLLAMAGGVAKYDPIYTLAAGTAGKATSGTTRVDCIGIAVAAASAGNAVSVMSDGLITYSGWSFTPGAPVYVAADGTITATCPSTTAFWTQQIGQARTATCIKVKLCEMVKVQ